MSGKKNLTREEELLLQDFSRNVSAKSSAFFYIVSSFVSFVPLYLYWRVFEVDMFTYMIPFAIGTVLNVWLMAFAYKNTKVTMKHRLSQLREDGVSREVMQKLGNAAANMSRREKDEQILVKKNSVADFESTNYSLFYNNSIFFLLVVALSCFLFRSFNPTFNFVFSVTGSASLLALLSTGSK